MTDLIQLADRCEKAGADEQVPLLIEAYAAAFGQDPINDECCGKTIDERIRGRYFRNMLDAEAFESAALMLVPEGCAWSVTTDFELPGRARIWGSVLPDQTQDRGWTADASTPALAIAAAALKARAGEIQNGGA